MKALDFIIERKLIVDENGDDVIGAHSTRHRVRAKNTIEAFAAFATAVNGEILGSIKPRGPGAAAGPNRKSRVCWPVSASIFSVLSSCQVT